MSIKNKGLVIAVVVGWSATATAQSWMVPRGTPLPHQLVAVDRTGEDDWPFGSEDVAGDGLDTFNPPEQVLDWRTAYATTSDDLFWFRAYVSADQAPDNDLRLYVFIDVDRDADTGGSAAAEELEASFVDDPTEGGYDHVIALQGDDSLLGVWNWDDASNTFIEHPDSPLMADVEYGTDADPLRLGSVQHGYLQVALDFDAIELEFACESDLFVRGAYRTNAREADLDLGDKGACVPRDANGNQIPDQVEPSGDCQVDADCPFDGVCIEGNCVYPRSCEDDADCADGERCTTDGRCVVRDGGECTDAANCTDGMVCTGGTCMACTSDGMCESGMRCGPDGRCSDGSTTSSRPGSNADGDAIELAEDEQVEGGAFNCNAVGLPERRRQGAWVGLLLLGGILVWRARQGGTS